MVTYSSTKAIPLLAKEGWTRRQENAAKPPLKGADGVVAHLSRYRVSDHPICAVAVASRNFSYWRSHPSFPRRGIGIVPKYLTMF